MTAWEVTALKIQIKDLNLQFSKLIGILLFLLGISPTSTAWECQKQKRKLNVHYNTLLNRWYHSCLKDLIHPEKYPTHP